MSQKQHSSVIAAGFALFSMFFGAGDLIWPLIIGGNAGDMNFWTVSGFLITAVSLPLLGLFAMMLFMGDYYAFFSRLGKIPSLLVIFIIQAIVGPVGSIPRLYTLAHATLQPYMPMDLGLFGFSVLSSLVVLAFTIRRQSIVDLLGLILTPILLLSIGAIVVVGFINHPQPLDNGFTATGAFNYGLLKGYNTLDMIAAFIFAPMVLSYFCDDTKGLSCEVARRQVARKMFQASLIAAGLLSTLFITMTYIAAYYVPLLPPDVANEARLSAIAMHLLGDSGALVACVAVVMACLTTAIPLTTIAADYIRTDLFRNKIDSFTPLVLVLLISGGIANLGFMGIADLLEPVLKMLCPPLIVLSILSIIDKLYLVPVKKSPVFAAFGLSTILYYI